MLRLILALCLACSVFGQDLPPATPEQIAQLTAQLEQMKAFIQAGQLKEAYGVNMKFTAQLGKLSIRVPTPEEQLLHIEELMAERPQTRIGFLAQAAKLALDAGQLDKADGFAKDLRTLAEPESNMLQSVSVHAAHILLGRVALQGTHDLVTAKAELLAAARVAPAAIQKFGPNMSLARDLLAAGERATVLEYVNSFHDLSPEAMDKLNRWAKLIQSGAIPDFGANILFYM